MTSVMNVVCNKDLFLYIQQFINGEDGIIRNFRVENGIQMVNTCQFQRNRVHSVILKEALMDTNWKVAERIYQKNGEGINKHILHDWRPCFYPRHKVYPHRVY